MQYLNAVFENIALYI